MLHSLAGGTSLARVVLAGGLIHTSAHLRSGPCKGAVHASGRALAASGNYLAPALALLPPGKMFEAPGGTVLRRVVDGLSRLPAILGHTISELSSQLLPGAAGDLLADWERAAGVDAAEVQSAYNEMMAVDAVLTAAGQTPPPRPTLDELRAAAVADRLTDRAPFTLGLLRQRALQTVFYRYAAGTPPVEVVERFSEVRIVILSPFRVSESAVGDALASESWRFAFDCTFFVQPSWGLTSSTWMEQQAARTPSPLWAWIRRRLPPWCGLRATVATSDGSCSVPLFAIRFPFPQE